MYVTLGTFFTLKRLGSPRSALCGLDNKNNVIGILGIKGHRRHVDESYL